MTVDAILSRLRRLMPLHWLASDSPVADAVLSGFAWAAQHCHEALQAVRAQGRLATASGAMLDLFAFDYLGLRYLRRAGQGDDVFRALVAKEIVRERVTRAGIVAAVADISGTPVSAWEPWNPTDCGGLDTPYLGFDETGRLGSLDMPYQIFVDAIQPVGVGIPNASGLDDGHGGFGQPILQFGDQSQVQGAVTNADICRVATDTRAAGITCWIAITEKPLEIDRLDDDFVLDVSYMM